MSYLGMFKCTARTELKELVPSVQDECLIYLNKAIQAAYDLGQKEIEELKQRNAELEAKNEELTNKVKALVSQLWRFRKIFRSDSYDSVSSAKSLREVVMVVDLSVDQMLAEHDREVAARAVEKVIENCQSQLNWQQTTHYKTVECFRFMNEYANKIKSGEVSL